MQPAALHLLLQVQLVCWAPEVTVMADLMKMDAGVTNKVPGRRWEVFEELMGYVGQHELMQSCHQVLIAYLHLLAALAGDDLGAQEVMNQLQLQVSLCMSS